MFEIIASRNGQIWPPPSFVTYFKAHLDLFSTKKRLLRFHKKLGPGDSPSRQSPKKTFFWVASLSGQSYLQWFIALELSFFLMYEQNFWFVGICYEVDDHPYISHCKSSGETKRAQLFGCHLVPPCSCHSFRIWCQEVQAASVNIKHVGVKISEHLKSLRMYLVLVC